MTKAKNTVKVCMLSVIMLIMLSTTASAVCWCNNTVLTDVAILPENADPDLGASKFRITVTCADTDGRDPKWSSGARHFYLSDDIGEGGYATVLTAASLGKNFGINAATCDSNSLLTILKMKMN